METINIIHNVLIIWAVWFVFSDGQIFGEIGNLLNDKLSKAGDSLNEWRPILKPLIGCPPCMASVWGVGYYLALVSPDIWSFQGLFIHVLCVCGVNVIIGQLIGE